MRQWIGIITGILGAVAAPNLASAKTATLEPLSRWHMDFGEQRCQLLRSFGTDDEKHLLIFRQWSPGRAFNFTASGPALEKFRGLRPTYARFQAAGDEVEGEPMTGDLEGFGASVIYGNFSLGDGPEPEGGQNTDFPDSYYAAFPQLDLEKAAEVEFIELRQGKRIVRFNTGPLSDAFDLMNTCTKSLVERWGLDPERHLLATRMPVLENFNRVAGNVARDYPREALNRGEQAILRIRVKVDETGKASDCVINDITSTDKLVSDACRPILDGRFTPALDAEGKPFASYWTTNIRYQIGS